MKRLPVILSFVFFLALCVSLTYWILQWMQPVSRPVAAPVAAAADELRLDSAAELFGGRASPTATLANVQLKGVVVADRARESVAILTVDGAPARAIGIGTEFQPGMTVREVQDRYVLITDGGAVKRIDLPAQSNTTTSAMPPNAQPLSSAVSNGNVTAPGSAGDGTVLSAQVSGRPGVTVVAPAGEQVAPP